jgi:hypothetical protein
MAPNRFYGTCKAVRKQDIMCSVNEVDFDDVNQCMENKSVLLYVEIILPKCLCLYIP